MATTVIRLNYALRSHIKERLTIGFNAQINRLKQDIDDLGLAMIVYERQLSPEHRQLAQKLNSLSAEQWVEQRRNLWIRIHYSDKTGEKPKNLTMQVTLPQYMPVPINFRSLNDYLPGMPHYDEVLSRVHAIDQIEAEKEHVVDTLYHDLLQRCTTLPQVVDVWPSVLTFVDPRTVATHHELERKRSKKARNKRIEFQITDEVVAALAKLRLLQCQA